MPHSSGGGSSGGGFHGGGGGGFHGHAGSSSSSNYVRHIYSRTPFVGCYTYVYYRGARPYYMYTNDKPSKSFANLWASLIISLLFLLVPIALVIGYGVHIPKKLNTNYNTQIIIKDDIDAISAGEEIELKDTLMSFYDKTGITPAVMTVESYPYTLKSYAYDTYIKTFNDEKHWLIVYYEGSHNYWAFEGMQGNDTDTILSERVTTRFNGYVYDDLSNGNTFATSLINSFNKITPTIMNSYFYLDSAIVAFVAIWTIILTIVVVFGIRDLINKYRLKDAILVGKPDSMKLVKCPYCGTDYYENTIKRCLKCGAELPYEDILTNVSVDNEDIDEH